MLHALLLRKGLQRGKLGLMRAVACRWGSAWRCASRRCSLAAVLLLLRLLLLRLL